MSDQERLDRRTFLRGAGLAAAALGASGFVSARWRGAEAQAPAAAGAAVQPGYFSFADDSSTLFTGSHLSFRSGFQTFAYASHADTFYYLQPCPSPGRGTTITEAYAHGDLRLSSVNTSGTARKDYMQLSGFGHGACMGVESTSEHSYVWMETDAQKDGTSTILKGRDICVFAWDFGTNKTYTPSDIGGSLPESQRFTLQPGSTVNSVSIDDVNKRLLLRHKASNGGFYYALYDLATVRAQGNAAKPVAGFTTIAEGTLTKGVPGSFQSFTVYGDYMYVITGDKPSTCTDGSGGPVNSNLIRYPLDSSTGPTVHTTLVRSTAPNREPEGICVYTQGSTRRLCFGIKYTDTCADSSNQQMAVYYKDEYVTT